MDSAVQDLQMDLLDLLSTFKGALWDGVAVVELVWCIWSSASQVRHRFCVCGCGFPYAAPSCFHTHLLLVLQSTPQLAPLQADTYSMSVCVALPLMPSLVYCLFSVSYWTFWRPILLFLFPTSTVCHAQLLPRLASLDFVCLPSSVDSCLTAHLCHYCPRNQPNFTLFHWNYNKRLVFTIIQCVHSIPLISVHWPNPYSSCTQKMDLNVILLHFILFLLYCCFCCFAVLQ